MIALDDHYNGEPIGKTFVVRQPTTLQWRGQLLTGVRIDDMLVLEQVNPPLGRLVRRTITEGHYPFEKVTEVPI